jgi:hypothetical protein
MSDAGHGRPFEIQEGALPFQPSGIPGQGSSTADHPMTGHDYRNSVSPHRGPDCAHGVFSLDPAGQFPVAYRTAEGDLQEGVPDLHLKRGALEVKRDDELSAPTGEVFVQLKGGVLEDSQIGLGSPAETGRGHGFILLAGEVSSGEVRTVRDEENLSKGAIEGSISIHLIIL